MTLINTSRHRSSAVLGGLLGATAVVGSLFALTSAASAAADTAAETQSETPAAEVLSDDLGDFEAYDACLERELGIDLASFDQDTPEPTEADWSAADRACESELPEGVELVMFGELELLEADLEDWVEVAAGEMVGDADIDELFAAFDACLERELDVDFDKAIDDGAIHDGAIHDGAIDSDITEDDWAAADKACEGELPEGVELLTAEEADLVDAEWLDAEWADAQEGEVAELIED